VAVNFATDPKHSLLAWLLVVFLSIAIATLTAVGERRKRAITATPLPTTTSTPNSVSAPVNSELIMRKTEHISPSGSKTITTDIYSKEVAMQSLGDDSFDEGQND